MYLDFLLLGDGEEEYYLEVCIEDLDLGFLEKNFKKLFSVKLFFFIGEDDWKVWFNRFKIVVKRRYLIRG